eukprot:gene26-36_t
MEYLVTDALIIYGFLLVILFAGLMAGQKVKDLSEYAIANRSYGAGVLVMTILATYLTGSQAIGYAGHVFDEGFFFPLLTRAVCGALVCFWFIGRYIAPGIRHFEGCFTLAEIMGKLYGPTTRVIIGLLGAIYCLIMVTNQMIWLGNIGAFINIPKQWSILLGGGLLVVYASRGGMKSIAITDVLQFMAVTVFVPLALVILLCRFDGLQDMLHYVPAETFTFSKLNTQSFLIPVVWYLFPAFPLSFPFVQRMLMAKNTRQITQSYYIAILYLVTFYLLLSMIGLTAIALKNRGDSDMPVQSSEVFVYLIKTYFPVGIKGIMFIGLIAAVISTADAFLRSAGFLISHDVIAPLLAKRYTVNFLRLIQYATLFLGLIALLVAWVTKILPTLLYGGAHWGKGINTARDFVDLVFTIPMIAGVMGLKVTSASFFFATIATGVTFVLGKLFLSDLWFMPITIAVNMVGFFFMPARRYSRNPVNKRPAYPLSRLPQQILNYAQKKVIQYGANYTAFAFFMTFHYMVISLVPTDHVEGLYAWLLMTKGVGVLLCIGLLLHPMWPKALIQFLPLYWYFTLLYCIPFTFVLFFLMNDGSLACLLNIALGVTLLIVVVDRTTFLILTVFGTFLGIFAYMQYVGTLSSVYSNSLYTLGYSIIASFSIGFVFPRDKEQSFERLMLHNQQLSEAERQKRTEFVEALQYRQQILEDLHPDEAVLFDEVTTTYMKQAIYRMTDYLRLTVFPVTLAEFRQELVHIYKHRIYPVELPELLYHENTQHPSFQADLPKIRQLLRNAISYLEQYNTMHHPVTVAVEDAFLGHEVAHMQGHIRQLEAVKITLTTSKTLPSTPLLYSINFKSSTWVPQQEDEFLLIENARIIDAHYGYIAEKSTHTQVYVLPVNLREIRGKVMELIKAPVMAVPEEVSHPISIKLEKELFEKLQGTAVDIQLVHKCLDIIKKYHGGTKRKSGEPFFTHPINVALIVMEYSKDQDAILGALLHDTVEDTSLSFVHIRLLFGKTVEFLVAKATNLEDHTRRVNLSAHENIVRITNYEDPRAALIKVADRLHNMRTIQYHLSVVKRRHVAQETLDYFVPLANRLNWTKMADELTQLSKAVFNTPIT